MNRYDEKVYRVTRSKNGPNLAEQKSQLARLKQDLEQFKNRQAGASVMGTLRERIRELEGSIAHAEASRAARRAGEEDDRDGEGMRPDQRATSSRFPPRGTPGRQF